MENTRHIFYERTSQVLQYAVKASLTFLMAVILLTMWWAAVKTFIDLKEIFSADIHGALKLVMVNSLTILALLEVFMTSLAYFKEGRVKVTYIRLPLKIAIFPDLFVRVKIYHVLRRRKRVPYAGWS